MKKSLFIGLALLSIGAVSCTMETAAPEQAPVADNMVILGATVPQTKAAVSDEGAFSWQEGDALSVWTGSAFAEFKLTEGAGQKTAQFAGTIPAGAEIGDIAVYPAGAHAYAGGEVTVNLPSEYVFETDNTNAPMVGAVVDGNIAFKAVGGVARFVAGIPNGASKVALLTGKKVTGDFVVAEDAITVAEEDAADKVVYTFTEVVDPVNMVFNFPLPVGEYTMTFQILNAEDKVMKELAGKAAHEIKASEVLIFNELALPNMPVKLNGKYEYETIAEAFAKAATLTDAESIDILLNKGTFNENIVIDGTKFTVPVSISGVSPYDTYVNGMIAIYRNPATISNLTVYGSGESKVNEVQDIVTSSYNYVACVYLLDSGYGVTIDKVNMTPQTTTASDATCLYAISSGEGTERDVVKNCVIGSYSAARRLAQLYGANISLENNTFQGPYSSYAVRFGALNGPFDAIVKGNSFGGTSTTAINLNGDTSDCKLVLGDGVTDDNKYVAGYTNRVTGTKAETFTMQPDKDLPYVNTPQPSVIVDYELSATSITEALAKAKQYGLTSPRLDLNASDEFAEDVAISGADFKTVTIVGKGQDKTKLTGSIEVKGATLKISELTIVTSDAASGSVPPQLEPTRDTYNHPFGILIGESGFGSIIKNVTFDMANSAAGAISAIYIAPYTNGFLADEVSGCTFLGTTDGMRHIQAYSVKAKIEGNKFYNPYSSYSIRLGNNDPDHLNEVTLKGNEFYNATAAIATGVEFAAGTYVLGDGETDDNVFEEGKFAPAYKAKGATVEGFTPAVTIDDNVITVVTEEVVENIELAKVWGRYSASTPEWWDKMAGLSGDMYRCATMDDEYVYIPKQVGGAEAVVYYFPINNPDDIKTLPAGNVTNDATHIVSCARIVESASGSKLLVSNLTTGATTWHVWKWDDVNSEPTCVLSYSAPDGCRLGDKFDFIGTWEDGEILALNGYEAGRVWIFKVKDGVVNSEPVRTAFLGGVGSNFGSVYRWFDSNQYIKLGHNANQPAMIYDRTDDNFALAENGTVACDVADKSGLKSNESHTIKNVAHALRTFEFNGKAYAAYVGNYDWNYETVLRVLSVDKSKTMVEALTGLDVTTGYAVSLSNAAGELGVRAPYTSGNGSADLTVRVIGGKTYLLAHGPNIGTVLFQAVNAKSGATGPDITVTPGVDF
ncbi:MAG: hypothetical protein IJ795_06575 [Bacteroidales bacterium]|nr:hypothetical protein [Bacteroidales bacterium]